MGTSQAALRAQHPASGAGSNGSGSLGGSNVLDQLFAAEFLKQLEQRAAELAPKYIANKPFPHIYFDDFLPTAVAELAVATFPDPDKIDWLRHRGLDQNKKLAFDHAEFLPSPLRDILFFLNSRPMLLFLEKLTGIQDIFGDPYYNGGGLHQIKPGGSLEVHADYSYHPKLKVDRRINVLVYLNKDWKEEYGGHFELWNRELTRAEAKILPVFNRCAIFSTTSHSYHGHPTPLTCPPDRTRKSIATYYFSNGRPADDETTKHAVAFVRRAGQKEPLGARIKTTAHKLVPPLFVEAYRKIRK
jgi:Rps23 Pro-64 3,4-dihydroxylase Tpa1-like proline 4-hydroxylase